LGFRLFTLPDVSAAPKDLNKTYTDRQKVLSCPLGQIIDLTASWTDILHSAVIHFGCCPKSSVPITVCLFELQLLAGSLLDSRNRQLSSSRVVNRITKVRKDHLSVIERSVVIVWSLLRATRTNQSSIKASFEPSVCLLFSTVGTLDSCWYVTKNGLLPKREPSFDCRLYPFGKVCFHCIVTEGASSGSGLVGLNSLPGCTRGEEQAYTQKVLTTTKQ
jgi:hypothetical protein